MRTCYAFAFGLSSLTAAFNGLQAQNSSGMLDTTTTESGLVRSGVLMADGQVVLSMVADTGLWLWSCDASGTPLWSARYGTDPLWINGRYPLIVCADNTLAFAYLAPQVEIGDSTLITMHVVRVGADGVLLWDKEIAMIPQEQWNWSSYVSPQELRLLETSDNDLILSLTIWQQVQYVHCHLTRLDGDGTFLWSRSIGYGEQPIFTEWNDVGPIGADGSGGCTLAWVPNTGGELGVASVDAAGNLQWATTCDYALSSMEFRPLDVMSEASGRIVVTSSMSSQYTDLQRTILEPSGLHIRTDGYSDFWWLSEARSVPLASGSALLLSNTYLEFDDAGQLVASVTLSNTGSNDVGDYSFASRTMDARSGQVLAAGDRSLTPILPGLASYTPGFIRTVTDAPGQCAYGGATALYVPMGNELFTFAPDTGIHIAEATVTIVDGIASTVPMPLLDTSPLCSTVGIAENDHACGFEVMNNLVGSGGTLLVRSDVPLDILLTDALGATVVKFLRSRNTGLTELPVGDLSSGVYIVFARNVSGQVVGAAKVVVE
jgi:hypothetical protein